jgi:hypothetical protein
MAEEMLFTCAICNKAAEGDGAVELPTIGLVPVPPRGWWSRNTIIYGRQTACCEEHARELMVRDRIGTEK